MKKTTRARTSSWLDYNRSLKQRRSLAVWLSDEAIANWTTEESSGERGASPTYTDLAIERKFIDAINECQAKATIPPRKGAKIWRRATAQAKPHVRDENQREIRKVGSNRWKWTNILQITLNNRDSTASQPGTAVGASAETASPLSFRNCPVLDSILFRAE
jgi:hypothetical protein